MPKQHILQPHVPHIGHSRIRLPAYLAHVIILDWNVQAVVADINAATRIGIEMYPTISAFKCPRRSHLKIWASVVEGSQPLEHASYNRGHCLYDILIYGRTCNVRHDADMYTCKSRFDSRRLCLRIRTDELGVVPTPPGRATQHWPRKPTHTRLHAINGLPQEEICGGIVVGCGKILDGGR